MFRKTQLREELEFATMRRMSVKKLRILLEERGISQSELARWLGRDKAVVTNLLQGKRLLKADEAMMIARQLGVSVADILEDQVRPASGAKPPQGRLEERTLIPFRHAPLQAKGLGPVVQRGGRYFLEDVSGFGDQAYALEVRDDSMNMLGILPGDVVISALDRVVACGQICVAQHYDAAKADAQTLIRRYDPPYLTAHSTSASFRPLHLEKDDIRVVSPVLKLVRLW